MGKDLVHGVDEFRMVDEGLPVICGRHRNRTVALHAPDNSGEIGGGALVPVDGFIPDDQAGDVRVAPGEIEGGGNLALISSIVLVDPDAKRDREAELGSDFRYTLQALCRGIGAHRLCLLCDRREICADLRFRYSRTVRRWFGKPVV